MRIRGAKTVGDLVRRGITPTVVAPVKALMARREAEVRRGELAVMKISPDDLRTIEIRNLDSGESFDVHLSEAQAIDLAAFCEARGLSPQHVIERAIEEFVSE